MIEGGKEGEGEGETHQVSFPWLGLVSVVVVPHGGLDPVHGEVLSLPQLITDSETASPA